MENPMIQVEHVSMKFHLNRSRTNSLKEWAIGMLKHNVRYEDFCALKDINLSVERGEILGIIGQNGSGKSTLLKVISGIYTPTSGKVIAAGRIAPMLELGSGFDYELTGAENIFLNGAVLGFEESFLKEKYNTIVEFSELGEFIYQPLKTYSSGMVMRLAFSIATLIEPEILIVDEILAVGDERFQVKSKERMLNLIGGGTTVLMVSHNLDQIMELCSRAIWLKDGLIQMGGSAKEVCREYIHFMNGE